MKADSTLIFQKLHKPHLFSIRIVVLFYIISSMLTCEKVIYMHGRLYPLCEFHKVSQ